MKNFRLSFLISVLLHLLMLYPILKVSDGQEDGSSGLHDKPPVEWVDIVELKNQLSKKTETESSQEEWSDVESDDSDIGSVPDKEESKQSQSDSSNDCSRYYWGIGILINFRVYNGQEVEEISHVYSGYPAEKNGLRAGDIILESDTHIKSDGPGPVTIKILRGNETFIRTIWRDKICYD